MKRFLVRKGYREWEPVNSWVRLAIDSICNKNNIIGNDKYYIYDTIEFRTCDEIIDFLVANDALGEFEICEIPDDYTDVALVDAADDYEFLYYVKNGRLYNEYNESVSEKRRWVKEEE